MIPGILTKEGLLDTKVGVSLDSPFEVLTCNAAVDFLIATLSGDLRKQTDEIFIPLQIGRSAVLDAFPELTDEAELRRMIKEGVEMDEEEDVFFVGFPESNAQIVQIALRKYAEYTGTDDVDSQYALKLAEEIEASLILNGKITPASLN